MGTVELAAGEFYYAEYGDQEAAPLVLLHGMRGDHSRWAGVAPDLAAAGYRVITPDARGHGRSPHTATYSFAEMRDDVLQFADRLGLDQFVLGGHSMGGTVATLFAERYPSRLRGLIVVDAPPPDGSVSYDAGPRPGGVLPYDWELVPAIYAQLTTPDPAWWAEIPSITAPALLIGGADSPIPPHLLTEMAEKIHGAVLVTVDGAGHNVHQDKPDDFLAAVVPFLSQLAKQATNAQSSGPR
ncbi:MAG TPA: alpha/beta hydrolase [Trebonia sp.]|nr:alpha/beta hydrolase [Trebonia sp.]